MFNFKGAGKSAQYGYSEAVPSGVLEGLTGISFGEMMEGFDFSGIFRRRGNLRKEENLTENGSKKNAYLKKVQKTSFYDGRIIRSLLVKTRE